MARNEIAKAVLDILREAPEPMTAQEFALQIVVQRHTNWQPALYPMVAHIKPILLRYRAKGVLASRWQPGQFQLWRVAS